MASTKKNATQNTLYFEGCKTIVELNDKLAQYLKADISDDTWLKIDEEFNNLWTLYKDEFNATAEEWQKMYGDPAKALNTAKALLTYEDEEKDLDFDRDCQLLSVGTWLWVKAKSGKDPEITRKYTALFKSIVGFNWNPQRKVWQWHDDTGKPWYPRRRGKKVVLPEEEKVFNKYGVTVIEAV